MLQVLRPLRSSQAIFSDNICTYLTIYSLKNIIDIYVKTPNMLAFFHALVNPTQTEILKLKAQNETTISLLVAIINCVV